MYKMSCSALNIWSYNIMFLELSSSGIFNVKQDMGEKKYTFVWEENNF